MDAPFVWILACGLVPKNSLKQVLPQLRVCVEEDRPRWEDDINSVNVLQVREIVGISASPNKRPALYVPRCSKSLYE